MIARLFSLFLVIFLCISSPSWAGIITIEAGDASDIIELKLGHEGAEKVFFLNNPERLVVDVPLATVPTLALPKNYRGSLLTRIRAGRFDADTVRIVFDLQQSGRLISQTQEGDTLILALAAGGGKSSAKPKPPMPTIVIDAGHGGKD